MGDVLLTGLLIGLLVFWGWLASRLSTVASGIGATERKLAATLSVVMRNVTRIQDDVRAKTAHLESQVGHGLKGSVDQLSQEITAALAAVTEEAEGGAPKKYRVLTIPTVLVDTGLLLSGGEQIRFKDPRPLGPGEVLILLERQEESTGYNGRKHFDIAVVKEDYRPHKLVVDGVTYLASHRRDDGVWLYRAS